MPCRNVGGIDRALRLVIGTLLLTAGLVHGGWTLTVVGALALTSGIVGFCPPYLLFGISTAKPRMPGATRQD